MFATPQSRLYILRHAHSSWALPGQRDHQRPLDERGRRDAPRLGAAIADADYSFDVVLCSTATRAVETLEAIRAHLPPGYREELCDELYALDCEAYLAKARGQGSAASVLMIGHNPMIEEFTLALAPSGEKAALETLRDGFPTSGLAVVEFGTGLGEIAAGKGYLRRLIHPRELGPRA